MAYLKEVDEGEGPGGKKGFIVKRRGGSLMHDFEDNEVISNCQPRFDLSGVWVHNTVTDDTYPVLDASRAFTVDICFKVHQILGSVCSLEFSSSVGSYVILHF